MHSIPPGTHQDQEQILVHQLKDYLAGLSHYHSTRQVKKSLVYKSLAPEIEKVVNGIEYGFYAPPLPHEKRPFYRIAAWNLERGIYHEGILDVLETHPDISRADVLLCPETDSGMARTQNLNIARDFAKKLKLNYFFAPSYLNLCIGNSVENHFEGENLLGLHGNVIFSRYPMDNLRIVPLMNCKDKMRGKEKRLGCQKALVADIDFPYQKVTVVCTHLDAHSSQRQRAKQMSLIIDALEGNPYPIMIGGDLNTSCYNARKAVFAFFGFWNKVFRGVDDVIANHYPYPDIYFDRFIFKVFRDRGFDYESFNEKGQGTLHFHVDDLKGNSLVKEVVPEWCRRVMEETLRRHGGKVSLKLDWFAAKGLKPAKPSGESMDLSQAQPPRVIGHLKKNGIPLSDHDAIVVDVDLY